MCRDVAGGLMPTYVALSSPIAVREGGNFRPTYRLIAQVQRILDINQINTGTEEVVDAARESLVIGT